MMDNSVSQLENVIREKAVRAFADDLQKSCAAAIERHGALTDHKTSGDMRQAQAAIVAQSTKRIGDAAVRKFLTKYGNLVAEFPHLQEQQQ